MRFFIALEIPSENGPQFQAIQHRLSTLITHIRLTNLDKIHLTLAFLGEQNDDLVPKLTKILEEAAADIPPFEVTPAYIDGFPSLHHPNVLWVGVKGDIDKVLLIRERVKDGLEALKLPVDERRFIPHITIAKTSHLQIDKKLEGELEKLMAESFEPIKITSIKLFESIPALPAGRPNEGFHSHNTLAEVSLK